MTTDDNKTDFVTEQTTTDHTVITQTNGKVEPTTSEVDINAKLDNMFANFNAKVDSLIETHKQETESLQQQINAKNEEIEKLKKINQQIILSTNVDKSKDEITDFSTVDFDSVNWDKEAASYMEQIDNKLYGTTKRSN